MRIATPYESALFDLRDCGYAMRKLGASIAEAAQVFQAFGLAVRKLRADRAHARLTVRGLRQRLGWRRLFSSAWYQAVYDLHQLTRGEA